MVTRGLYKKEYEVAAQTTHVMKEDALNRRFLLFLLFGGNMRSEAAYQRALIDRLEKTYPGCLVIKNDAAARQGIPDLLILWGPRWAMLEVKHSQRSPIQPNQEYYVEHFSRMSFACFIYPEIEEEVLTELYFFMHS